MRNKFIIFLFDAAIVSYIVFVSLCTLACLLSCTGIFHKVLAPDPVLTWGFFCFGGSAAITFVVSVYREGIKDQGNKDSNK